MTATGESAVDVADEVFAEIGDHLGNEPFAVIGNPIGGMFSRQVAHEHRDHVLGVATLAGVVHPPHSDRAVLERTMLHTEPSGLEATGDARPTVLQRPMQELVDDVEALGSRVKTVAQRNLTPERGA